MRALAIGCLFSVGTLAAQSATGFESPQVRPLAISPDGSRMLAVNTPAHRVVLFSLEDPLRPAALREIDVGLEPVSVAFRTPTEAWVVSHLGDAVDVVDLDRGVQTATIRVGDEPSDLRFAAGHAFVTLATRRQVAVIDVATLAIVTHIAVFGDEPRWSTTNADGSRLFVAAHKSGNETTIVPTALAPPQTPPTNPALPPPPAVGKIVHSEDPAWTSAHGVDLPDYDVFEIDTATFTVVRRHAAVGTLLFGMATRPGDGSLWVANTEARNLVDFEPALRGHIVDSRVTRIDVAASSPAVTPFDLNANVDYSILPNPGALATALAQPTDLAFSPLGDLLYVAAFGTDRIGIVDPATGLVIDRIEIGETPGVVVDPARKRGPRGLAHHPSRDLLYVASRLSNSITVVDTAARAALREIRLPDPTPEAIRAGRGFFYDAKLAGNGTQSCAVCHVDATTDNLAWNLGDPGGSTVQVAAREGLETLHPMKGPLMTQTLIGVGALAPLHWRGDRSSIADFAGAFDSLLGGTTLGTAEIESMATFLRDLQAPPNPNQNLDRSDPTLPATASVATGRVLFRQPSTLASLPCSRCHENRSGTNGELINESILQDAQTFRTAPLQNIYKRDGRRVSAGSGQRTAGFGLSHDGSVDDTLSFLERAVFGPLVTNPASRQHLQAFVEAFDTGTAPIVGYAVTIDSTNHDSTGVVADRDLLVARARARDCDLVARGTIDGRAEGLSFDRASLRFLRDRTGEPSLDAAALDALFAQGRATLTWTAAPLGGGTRLAIDVDRNGIRDGDERPVEFGTATAGCALTLRLASSPTLGNGALGLVTRGATPGAAGSVFVGFQRAAVRVLGIDLLVAPATLVALPTRADPTGTAAVPLSVPEDAGLRGLHIVTQSIFVDTCGPAGIAASNGLEFVLR